MFAPSLNLDLEKLGDSEAKGKKKASDKAKKATKADAEAEGAKGTDA
jgi:hypothetical protein